MRGAIKLNDSYRKSKRGWQASSRIRGHSLAKYWDELDDIFYPEYFNQEYNEFFEKENQLKLLKDYDFIIIHKAYENELIKDLHNRGQKIIIDLSDPDYLLGYSNVGRAAQCLASLAHSDAAVVNNKLMISDLEKGYDKPIFYIPDRIDCGDISKPKNLVWFGHYDNKESLTRYLSELKDYNINVICNKPIEGTNFVEYNPETMNDEIKKFDAVFLGDKLNEYKSPNRYLTAVSLGIPVFTIEALRDFGIKKSIEEYKEVIKQICP